MTANSAPKIRDFIYLDVPALFSIYSQVFEGVSTNVVEERIKQLFTGDTQRSFLSQASGTSESGEVLRHTEASVLHDHMYNKLEHELESVVTDAENITPENIHDIYIHTPLIKVVGGPELEDYERLRVFYDKFNELGHAIAYSHMSTEAFRAQVAELEAQLQGTTDSKKRNDIKEKLHQLQDPNVVATKLNLYQDPKALDNLKLFLNTFAPDNYFVIIAPRNGTGIQYRGVLNRAWLRTEPQLIRSLYGLQSDGPWTMVGIITNAPKFPTEETEPALIEDSAVAAQDHASHSQSSTKNSTTVSMLDAFRGMVHSLRAVEDAFLRSNKAVEVTLSPLAIYREFGFVENLPQEGETV